MNTESQIHPKGEVEIHIEYNDGRKEEKFVHNTVLKTGREALVNCLINSVDSPFNLYVESMVFGSGGVDGFGVPRYVDVNRIALFGPQVAEKAATGTADSTLPYQANFISVLTFSDLDGIDISEMGLKLANGDLYSMTTFGSLHKTTSMQITWVWRITFV